MSDSTITSAPESTTITTPESTVPVQDNVPATADATAPEQSSQDNATQEPTPQFTLAQANATLARFAGLVQGQAEHNYRLASTAALFVEQFLGAAPGKAQRSTAVDRLARADVENGEWSMALPEKQAMTRAKERINLLLRVNAVVQLLGDGRGVEKGDGTAKGRGKAKDQTDKPLPWGKVRELAPLVERVDGEHAEQYAPLSDAVQAKGRELVAEAAKSGMARQDLVLAVSKICLEHYNGRLDSAIAALTADPGSKALQSAVKDAEQQVERWGGKVERRTAPAQTGPVSGEPLPAAAPQSATAAPAQTGETGTAKDNSTAPPQPSKEPKNLLPAGTQRPKDEPMDCTPEQWAAQLAEMVFEHADPEATIVALIGKLKASGKLSSGAVNALAAALVTFDRVQRQRTGNQTNRVTAAPLPSTNGVHATAGAA